MRTIALSIASALLLLNSCVSVKRSGYTQDVSRTDIIQSPLMADLEVDTKGRVSAEFTAKGSEHNAKQGALYEAMQRNGCDVLVHPFYEVKFYPMSIIKANVTGYCGKYKAIRKPNLEDTELMQQLIECAPLYNSGIIIEKPNVIKLK